MPTRGGSFKLFTFAGISVYVHWMWFLAAAYFVTQATGYSSPVWSVLECLSMFLIVLIHEFVHAFACRSVGGQANEIVLWLFGGVAYVSPPQRPGAQLWSIAAGPLVNVVLIPILTGLWILLSMLGWEHTAPQAFQLIYHVQAINILLLIFNLMPVYPLDGGQILRSLLWFVIGPARSLMAASTIGFIGVAGMIILAAVAFLRAEDAGAQRAALMFGCMVVFILMSCWSGLKHARALGRLAKLPRRAGFACPSCHAAPPSGALWRCGKCGQALDIFLTQGACPHCGAQYQATQCLDCGAARPLSEWSHPEAGSVPPPL